MHRVESFRDASVNGASDRTSMTSLLPYICKQMECVMGLKLTTLAENSVICPPSLKEKTALCWEIIYFTAPSLTEFYGCDSFSKTSLVTLSGNVLSSSSNKNTITFFVRIKFCLWVLKYFTAAWLLCILCWEEETNFI